MSLLYNHENLVRIQALVHKILREQERVMLRPMPMPMQQDPHQNQCSPQGHNKRPISHKPSEITAPRSLIGRIYVGDHYTLLHTKYISCGPHGFREENFFSFFHYKSMVANGPWGVASLGPWDLIGRIYVGDHYTLLHTKYISCGPHGFREENFFSFFHYKSMVANGPWGVASLGPWDLIGRIYLGDH